MCIRDSSLPLLLISAEPKSESLGKGEGVLHEITEQKKVTEPLTAFSETVKTANDVPILLEQAFTIFRSKRPRPVHISIPIDIQAKPVNTNWEPIQIPPCPKAREDDLLKAISLINESKKIVCISEKSHIHIRIRLVVIVQTKKYAYPMNPRPLLLEVP